MLMSLENTIIYRENNRLERCSNVVLCIMNNECRYIIIQIYVCLCGCIYM